AGNPDSTDIDNAQAHNPATWTTDLGCADVVYKLHGAGTNVTLTTRAVGADWDAVLYARSASQGCTTDAYADIMDASERVDGAAESISFFAQSGVDYYVTVASYGGVDGVACETGSFILNAQGIGGGGGAGTCTSPNVITAMGDQPQASTAG